MTENIRETLRNNLTIYINRSSITQKNLAEQLGVSKGAVTNWLNGSNSPNIEILAKICQILGVKMSEMLSDNSEISADEKEWFKKYHKLNNHGKKVVNAVLDIEIDLGGAPEMLETVALLTESVDEIHLLLVLQKCINKRFFKTAVTTS